MKPVFVSSMLAVALFGFSIHLAAQGGRAAAPAPAGQAARGPQPTPPCGPNLTIKNVDKQSRCFELRTYTVREGSSIDLLHSRFRDHTTALFKKHGMTIVGYWQPVAKPDTLIYILAYKDAAARDAAWAAFNADPEWVKTRTEMQVNVQVDNVFMAATDYSPMK
jgi:NIPSNAP protein